MTTPPTERPRRERHEPQVPEAAVALDDRSKALSLLLPEIFKDFDVEFGAKVDEVTVAIRPQDLPAICRIAKDEPRLDCNYLRCLSVVDYVEHMEISYHLFSLNLRHKFVLKTSVSPDEPYVPSIISIWRGADWYEREGHDLFGVVFEGHPNLSPLLLYEGFEGFPGRRSFPLHDYDEW